MNKTKFLAFCFIPFFVACAPDRVENKPKQKDYTGKELAALNTQLAGGWNTWDTRSVLSHVLLPEGFGLHLQLKDH